MCQQEAVLFSRGVWTLLAGQLQPELTLDVLEACRARQETDIKSKLAAYESKPPGDDSLVKFRPALCGGDTVAGREVFRTHANAQCIRCHEAGGEGYQAGPVLAGIATRATPEYLLESLIDPSRRIAEGFATISLVTRDGEVIAGTKLRETGGQLTLRLSSGEIRKVAQTDIAKQSTSSVSAMPPMGEVLTLFEIRDLLAYLGTLK
jgi:putative heme-binding domain-containing protein